MDTELGGEVIAEAVLQFRLDNRYDVGRAVAVCRVHFLECLENGILPVKGER